MALTQISTQGIKDGTITGSDLATNIDLVDNQKIRLGNGQDLLIFHDGTDSFIDNNSGSLKIQGVGSNGFDVHIQARSDEEGIKLLNNSGESKVELYYNNNKKFETASNGVTLNDGLLLDNATNAGRDVQWQPTNDRLAFLDNTKATFGNGADLQIYHDGSNSEIKESIGNLNIICNSSQAINLKHGAENMLRAITDGSVELYYNNNKKFETTSGGVQVTDNLNMSGGHIFVADNFKLNLGTSDDLQIYHDGSDSYIYQDGTGELKLNTATLRVMDRNGGETQLLATENGAVELYFNNSKKFETTSNGAKIDSGHLHIKSASATTSDLDMLIVDGGSTGFNQGNDADTEFGIQFRGCSFSTSTNIQQRVGSQILMRKEGTWNLHNGGGGECKTTIAFTNSTGLFSDGTLAQVDRLLINSDGNVQIPNDSGKLQLGASQDLQIYHDGNNSIITAGGAGDLQLISTFDDIEIKAADNIFIRPQGGEEGIKVMGNGAVELYHDNGLKLTTLSSGVQMANGSGNNTLSIFNSDKLSFGNSGELKIFHNGTNSFIQDTAGASFTITATESIAIKTNDTEFAIACNKNGAVELYHDNVKMLDTSSQGVNFRGEIRSASTDSNLSNCTLKNESTSADATDYLQCRTDNNTAKLVIEPDGDVKNQNQSYGQLSDSKLKENIVDANSQWNDIKAIKVRNFNFKESTGFSTHTQIGVVAQELEITSPHLVYESIDRDSNTGKDLGTKTKNVRYSVMYMKAIKCLQEAMAKIEVLETEVAALKAA